MNTKSLLKTFIILGIIAIAIVTYYFQNPDAFRKGSVIEQAQKQGVSEIALNGTVIRKTDDAIFVKTGFMKSDSEGSRFVSQEKKVSILATTKLYKADETTETSLAEIFTGAVVTVYIPIESVEKEEVTANTVVVDRQ